MSVQDETSGNIIALEGDVGTITTQLRLLPPSSKILTLPSFSSALKATTTTDETFDVRSYVRNVHETFTKRCEHARKFLRSSTSSQPRLVFMNGGCVSARTACITKITEEMAGGDVQEGERIFDALVRRGVAGLYDAKPFTIAEEPNTEEITVGLENKVLQEEPASMEPQKDEEGPTLADPPSRSPNDAFHDAESNAQKFEMSIKDGMAAKPTKTKAFPEIPNDNLTSGSRSSFEKRTSFGSYDQDNTSDVGEDDGIFEEAEEHSEVEKVQYGKALVVHVRKGSSNSSLRRSRSMDRVAEADTFENLTPTIRRVRSAEFLRTTEKPLLRRGSSWDALPRTVYVRRGSKDKDIKPLYVDQGTNPIPEDTPAAPFEPVFPLVEDLIINFSDGIAYELFDSVIRSYKDGSYPKRPGAQPRPSVPNSPTFSQHFDEIRPQSTATVETDDEGYHSPNEVNPYNVAPGDGQAQWPKRVTSKAFPSMLSVQSPPTPATTPPPYAHSSTSFQKFVEFSPLNIKTPLGVQNSFRTLLAQRFPPALGYKQLLYASETDRFWKPVLRIDEGYGNEGRTVDQIIAIGYAERVNKDLFHTVSSQIERVGAKRSGLSKSATIDIRYLVSTALQSIAQQSPADEKASDPMAYPAVLAELLVPHLEAYLAGNELARLLVLKYDPVMLPTVLELRRIIGEDAFKVAGIVDSSGDPRVAAPPTNMLSNEGTSMLNARSRFSGNYRYNSSGSIRSSAVPQKRTEELLPKANFLLSSTASENEIHEFVASIRKVVSAKNSFFEPEAEPVVVPTPIQAPPPIPASTVQQRGPRARSRSKTASSRPKELPDRPETPPRTPGAAAVDPWEGFVDSDDDEMDRIFMPLVPMKGMPRKGNSRKALKWLGLA